MFGTAEVGTWVPRSRTGAAVLRTGAAIFEPLATDPMKTHFRSFFSKFLQKMGFFVEKWWIFGIIQKMRIFSKKIDFFVEKSDIFFAIFFQKNLKFFSKKTLFLGRLKMPKISGQGDFTA